MWRRAAPQLRVMGSRVLSVVSSPSVSRPISRPAATSNWTGSHGQAWMLMEACLESGNLERAESVLLGLTELGSDEDVPLAINNYLLRLVEMNAGRPQIAKDWLSRVERTVPRFRPNDVTEAIMLKNACLSGSVDYLRVHLKQLQPPNKLAALVKHVEVLGVQHIKKIAENNGVGIPIDRQTSKLINSLEEPSLPEATFDSVPLQEPIQKEGFEALEPTYSTGLKSIRHVLGGLRWNRKHLKDLPVVQDKSLDLNNFIDFFELSKQISEDERPTFEAWLDRINEERQQKVEMRGIEAARMKWKEMFEQMAEMDRPGSGSSLNLGLGKLEALLWHWSQSMTPLVQEEIAKCKEVLSYESPSKVPKSVSQRIGGSVHDRFEYGPYLVSAKPENLPAMTMMELLRLNSTRGGIEGVRIANAVLSVGRNVELEYRLSTLKKRERETLKGVPQSKRHTRAAHSLRRRLWESTFEGVSMTWPTAVRAKLGSLLISLLMRVAKVPVYAKDPVTGAPVRGHSPAFHHTYQYQNGNKVGVLRPHKLVAQHLSGENAATIQPQQLPMLVEPRPWTAWNRGGYHYTTTKIIRSREAPEQLAYVIAASRRNQLDAVYDGLNTLGRTAWTINKDMYRIISKIWNSKKAFLDIPPHVSPHPDLSHLKQPERNADPVKRREYLRECRALTLQNGAWYSQRCDLNYKLDIARAFLGERFYQPHNLDFRGRAYPLSPHLTHLGSDVSRSLLMFWRGRELGPQGLRWIKVHLANLCGVNKANHDERVMFVDEHWEDVVDSAKNPLDGKGWWQTVESPFQALAACMDLVRAVEHPEGPEKYRSHLTIHQDGSCNGLQHYAALGGDAEGAREVNLAVADKPQDVYSRVLEIVRHKVQNDADNGNIFASVLLPVLTRKVVKQTVMTHVYGVTLVGAREQISNRLREIESFPQEQRFRAAHYLATRVLGAVRELFESAHKIQDWLGDNATRITRSILLHKDLATTRFMSSVIWTTPLGLPIVQPYRKEKRRQVSTELQTIYLTDPDEFESVNPRKQRTAFPPNYIHSLDATHMLMSATACGKEGIDFAAVHDSYWTHAGDVDVMNRHLRECFVELHSHNLIEDLREEFKQRYMGHVQLVDIPLDSEVGRQCDELGHKYTKIHGHSRAPTINDLVQLELSTPPEEPTPYRILKKLAPEEIDDLVARAKATKPSAARIHQQLRSTEHAGSGLDRIGEVEAALDAEEEPEEEPCRRRTRQRKVVRVLAPLDIPEVPSRGSFHVSQVLSSPYFFS